MPLLNSSLGGIIKNEGVVLGLSFLSFVFSVGNEKISAGDRENGLSANPVWHQKTDN
jgi:hypothetical protein